MRKTKKQIKKRRLNYSLLFTIALIIVAGGAALAANRFAAAGFEARMIQDRIQKLAEENQNLEIQAANLKSMQNLKDSVLSGNVFVPVRNINYLRFTKTPSEGSVGQIDR